MSNVAQNQQASLAGIGQALGVGGTVGTTIGTTTTTALGPLWATHNPVGPITHPDYDNAKVRRTETHFQVEQISNGYIVHSDMGGYDAYYCADIAAVGLRVQAVMAKRELDK